MNEIDVTRSVLYGRLADGVLLLHTALVLFVVVGLVVVVVGNARSWRWANAPWFRLLHLAIIVVVVAESWLGIECPLTTLELWLRAKAGTVGYSGGFIEHGLRSVLFWQAPPWVFTTAYSLFGLAVVATWWFFPPTFGRRRGVAA